MTLNKLIYSYQVNFYIFLLLTAIAILFDIYIHLNWIDSQYASEKDIVLIRDRLKMYEKNIRKPYYYSREDIAFVPHKIYQREVYLPIVRKGSSIEPSFYIKAYKKDTLYKNKILFDIPKGFNNYEAYQ